MRFEVVKAVLPIHLLIYLKIYGDIWLKIGKHVQDIPNVRYGNTSLYISAWDNCKLWERIGHIWKERYLGTNFMSK